jgi:hypothetical protein
MIFGFARLFLADQRNISSLARTVFVRGSRESLGVGISWRGVEANGASPSDEALQSFILVSLKLHTGNSQACYSPHPIARHSTGLSDSQGTSFPVFTTPQGQL